MDYLFYWRRCLAATVFLITACLVGVQWTQAAVQCGPLNFQNKSGTCLAGSYVPPTVFNNLSGNYSWQCQDYLQTISCQANSCGDNAINYGEQCDGSALDGKTCQSFGFSSGDLKCSKACYFDTTSCQGLSQCGNNKLEAGEQCDGSLFQDGKNTCTAWGFDSGTLKCATDCTVDTDQCIKAKECGNNKVEAGEQCDGSLFQDGKNTCTAWGFKNGNLKCAVDCKISGCFNEEPAVCGNGKKESGEECDVSAFDPLTCQSFGYDSGQMICDPQTCKIMRDSQGAPYGCVKSDKCKTKIDGAKTSQTVSGFSACGAAAGGLYADITSVKNWLCIGRTDADSYGAHTATTWNWRCGNSQCTAFKQPTCGVGFQVGTVCDMSQGLYETKAAFDSKANIGGTNKGLCGSGSAIILSETSPSADAAVYNLCAANAGSVPTFASYNRVWKCSVAISPLKTETVYCAAGWGGSGACKRPPSNTNYPNPNTKTTVEDFFALSNKSDQDLCQVGSIVREKKYDDNYSGITTFSWSCVWRSGNRYGSAAECYSTLDKKFIGDNLAVCGNDAFSDFPQIIKNAKGEIINRISAPGAQLCQLGSVAKPLSSSAKNGLTKWSWSCKRGDKEVSCSANSLVACGPATNKSFANYNDFSKVSDSDLCIGGKPERPLPQLDLIADRWQWRCSLKHINKPEVALDCEAAHGCGSADRRFYNPANFATKRQSMLGFLCPTGAAEDLQETDLGWSWRCSGYNCVAQKNTCGPNTQKNFKNNWEITVAIKTEPRNFCLSGRVHNLKTMANYATWDCLDYDGQEIDRQAPDCQTVMPISACGALSGNLFSDTYLDPANIKNISNERSYYFCQSGQADGIVYVDAQGREHSDGQGKNIVTVHWSCDESAKNLTVGDGLPRACSSRRILCSDTRFADKFITKNTIEQYDKNNERKGYFCPDGSSLNLGPQQIDFDINYQTNTVTWSCRSGASFDAENFCSAYLLDCSPRAVEGELPKWNQGDLVYRNSDAGGPPLCTWGNRVVGGTEYNDFLRKYNNESGQYDIYANRSDILLSGQNQFNWACADTYSEPVVCGLEK